MKNKSVALICGALIALVTVALYMLLCNNIFSAAVSRIAVVFTVLSEAVTTVAFAFSGGEPRRVGGAVASLIQTIITIVTSVIFIGIPFIGLMLRPYIAIYAVTFVISAIMLIVLFNFADTKKAENVRTAAAKMAVIRCRTIVQSMINSDAGREHADKLRLLDEDLRFMDDSVSDPMDEQILSQLEALANGYTADGFPFDSTVAHIRDTIKQRNFVVKSYKLK